MDRSPFFRLLFLFVLLQLSVILHAQLPPDFYDELWDNDFDRITGITFDPDGRGFIWERNGLVHRMTPEGERLPTPLLDIREEVADWSDMGMVGFALHPNFTTNGYFYVFYSVDRHYLENFGSTEYDPDLTITDEATIARLSRFTADSQTDFTTLVPDSKKIILGATYEDGAPLVFKTHATGSLVFGTDGTLLATIGETAFPDDNDFGSNANTYYQQAIDDGIIRPEENVGAFRSQLINSLSGKIIRIDPETGEGLPSNPFYDASAPKSPQSRVWAIGFRNPYRFLLVPETGSHFPEDGAPGHLIVADVGGNEWEEITLITGGGQNAGWPFFEGLELRPAAVNSGIQNRDLPAIGCSTDFIPFADLIREEGATTSLNPSCNNLPADYPLFEHRRPFIAYRNKAEGRLPDARIPTFTSEGEASSLSLSAPSSPVAGDIFHGIGSMTGTYYSGTSFPSEYQGRYLHIDYLGWMKWMEWDTEGHLTRVEDFHDTGRDIVCLTVHPIDGSLWYIDVQSKQLRRIGYGGIPRPIPVIEASSWYGPSPLQVELSASNSSTLTDYPLDYLWEFPDGQTSIEETISLSIDLQHQDPTPWPVRLTVTDSLGQSATIEKIISLNNTPPVARITSFKDGALYPITETSIIQLHGEAEDQEFSSKDLAIEWQVFLEHDDHEHNGLPKEGIHNFAILSPLGCLDDFYAYRIELTVSDPAGLSGKDIHHLYPNCESWISGEIQFSAEATDQLVLCKWLPTSRPGVRHYIVQRSIDGLLFSDLDTVQIGSSFYQYTDPSPYMGTNYYRLRLDFENDAFYYSPIKGVLFPGEGNFRLFPNPAEEQINLSILTTHSTVITYQVINTDGRVLLAQDMEVPIHELAELKIDLRTFQEGTYFLVVSNGKEIFKGSFIKIE